MAESEYYNSEGVSILTDANITMASNIQSSAGGAYQNAGYSLGQQLTKGISSAVSSYVPPSIRVPVVYGSTTTESSGGGGVYSSDPTESMEADGHAAKTACRATTRSICCTRASAC